MKNALYLSVCLTWLMACSSGVGGTEDRYYQPDSPDPAPAKTDTTVVDSTAKNVGGASSVAGSSSEGGASEESDAGSPSTGGTEQHIILL